MVEGLHLPGTCPTDCQWKRHKQEVLLCWRTVWRGTLLGRGLSGSPPSCAAAAAVDLALTCRREDAGCCCSTQGQVGEALASEIVAALVAAETYLVMLMRNFDQPEI